jgi:histidinol dehydrogenase
MPLRLLDLRGNTSPLEEVLPRPHDPGSDVHDAVAEVLGQVRQRGDEAIIEYAAAFDQLAVADAADLRVPPDEVMTARSRVPYEVKDALELSYERIESFHAHEGTPPGPFHSGGVTVDHLARPVRRAGLYAPGGRARYPSTVLMCAAPARVAGVEDIVLCVPPAANGRVDDATLAAAAVAGITEVYRIGGAQAIAAMAFGTATVPRVDVIAGPGNAYVAEAKRQVSGVVGVASAFAGPSEIVVVAGPDAPPEFAAIDLVVQAEHGPDGLAWLVTWDEDVLTAVSSEVDRIVAASPRRADLESTLDSAGIACLVTDSATAMAVANTISPEHLQLMVSDDEAPALVEQVENAGAVFIGPWAPASLGDYVAGPNHVLPTNRTARFSSALRADDFRRHIHVVSVTPDALRVLGPPVITLADVEGLPAHADSVRRRLSALDRPASDKPASDQTATDRADQ